MAVEDILGSNGFLQSASFFLSYMFNSPVLNQNVHSSQFSLIYFRYFFPTYEDDNLLCSLEDAASDDITDDVTSLSSDVSTMSMNEAVVVAEDLPVTDSILRGHPELTQELISSWCKLWLS